MRSSFIMRITIVLITIIWGLKSVSDFIYIKGEHSAQKKAPALFRVSSQLFPVSSQKKFMYALSKLNSFNKTGNRNDLIESIKFFRNAIDKNRLNYFAHMYLGRAMMNLNSPDPDIFKNAMRAIKNASLIRRSDKGINSDTVKIYLSMWPFISKEEKDFTKALMKSLIKKIDKKSYRSILEIWRLYSRDKDFLTFLYGLDIRYYYEVEKILQREQIHLDVLQLLKASREVNTLVKLRSEFEIISKKRQLDRGKLESIYRKLTAGFFGYNILLKNKNFKIKTLNKLKKSVLSTIIKIFLIKKNNLDEEKRLAGYIDSYIDQFNSISELDYIENLLGKYEYFKGSGLNKKYLRYRIMYASGNYSQLITEIEKFKKSLSFVNSNQVEEYGKILFLQSDGFAASRLLTRAMDILKEIEKIVPGNEDIYWRLFKIEKIIGEDDFFKDLKKDKFEKILNSDSILLNKRTVKQDIYLYDKTGFNVEINEEFKSKLKDYSLLQIFNGQRIIAEFYTKNLKFPIAIDLPSELKDSKITVTVTLKK